MKTTDTNNQEEQHTNLSEEQKMVEPDTAAQEKSWEEKHAELNDKYLRLYADFENFRKRSSKERIDLIKYASEEVFKQIIPVLDDFERAVKSTKDATDINVLKQGEELIYNKFKSILVSNGLQEMNATGEPFNADIHDAITNVPAPKEDQKGKVIDEVEKGYYLSGKVIRHAKVVVGN